MAYYSGQFEKIAVILSTGWTGTMALAHYFDASYDQVKALHEPKPSRRLRLASNRYLYGQLSKSNLAQQLIRSQRRLFRDISEPFYIESNGFLHGFLDVFDDVFGQL